VEVLDVLVPVVSDGSHSAELALDSLGLDQRVARDNAGLPSGVALRAGEGSLVETLVSTVLASAGREDLLRAIHVDFKDPVADLITLLAGKQVLLG